MQWRLFHLHPLDETLIAIGTLFGAYFLLLGIEFLYNLLVAAPPALDFQQAEVITGLEAQISALRQQLSAPTVSPLERERRDLVANRLMNAAEEDIAVYKYVLQHGQVDPIMLTAGGVLDGGRTNPHLIQAAIQRGFLSGLLCSVPVAGKARQHLTINVDLRGALSFHLFGE